MFDVRCTFWSVREETENASVSDTWKYTNYCRQECLQGGILSNLHHSFVSNMKVVTLYFHWIGFH